MKIKLETVSTLLKTGLVYGVVSFIAILCAVSVLIEGLFVLLMSLTTSLRLKTIHLVDSTIKTCSRFVTGATTQRLKTSVDAVIAKLHRMLEKIGG